MARVTTVRQALTSEFVASVRQNLIAWYERHRRDLPWRRTRDPYAIWVSEVMLQQTQVKTVLDYWRRWMERFPTVEHLAVADEADVLHAWQGLGYYSRARQLLAAARVVRENHGGTLPRDAAALRSLPGIGPYSAGAIASIAYGLPEPIVDGNVIRVLSRLLALRGDPAKAPLKKELWRAASELVPADRASDFNQGLMELGATVCTPGAEPACERCPLRELCRGRALGVHPSLPELAKRKPKEEVRTAAALVRHGERILLRRVPEDADRWANLWVLPFVELESGESPGDGARRALGGAELTVAPGDVAFKMRHTITRFKIELAVVPCALSAAPRALPNDFRFVTREESQTLALPSVHARILTRLPTL